MPLLGPSPMSVSMGGQPSGGLPGSGGQAPARVVVYAHNPAVIGGVGQPAASPLSVAQQAERDRMAAIAAGCSPGAPSFLPLHSTARLLSTDRSGALQIWRGSGDSKRLWEVCCSCLQQQLVQVHSAVVGIFLSRVVVGNARTQEAPVTPTRSGCGAPCCVAGLFGPSHLLAARAAGWAEYEL